MSFASIIRSVQDRNFGGTDSQQVAEPYISGYHFSYWRIACDDDIISEVPGNEFMGGAEYISDGITAAEILQSTCLSITPPGGTINKTEIIGLGGTKWSVPTNIDYGTTLSCKFLEMRSLPVFRIIHTWCKEIRDNKSGLSSLYGDNNSDRYSKDKYSAVVFYWTTMPDGKTVEFASCYSGVFPLKDPQDLFTSDLSSVDKLELDIEFNVDFIYQDSWVYTKCSELAEQWWNGKNSNRVSEDGALTDLSYHS